MDTVRFGRVLGRGARQAAKTLVSAVDAAKAPNPRPPSPHQTAAAAANSAPPEVSAPSRPHSAVIEPTSTSGSHTGRPVGTVLPPSSRLPKPPSAATPRGLAEGSRRFGRAVWGPAVRLSGVLWLELTGVFFGLFALIAGIAAWRLRSALFAVPASPGVSASDDRTRFFFAAGMVCIFGYFSLSSFLKANRRSRNL